MAKEAMLIEAVEEVVWGVIEEGQEADPCVIYNVLLCGPESKNGRKYRPESYGGMQNVAAMYENKPVYYNHSEGTSYSKAKDRKIEEIAGVVRNARWIDGKGVVGNIHTLDENERLLKLYKLRAPGIGMSHSAVGRLEKNNLAIVSEVISVDVVVNPATTKTFVEQEKKMDDSSLASELSTVRGERDGFKAERDKLQTQLSEAQQTLEKLAGEVTALTEQTKQLNDKLAIFEQEKAEIAHKALVEKEITEAGLSGKLTPVVISIIESLDNDKRKALIEEQVKVIKGAGGSTPGNLPRIPAAPAKSAGEWDVKAFTAQFAK